MRHCTAIIAATLCALLLRAQTGPMKSAFSAPPHEAQPQVWWHWMNGNISREGIRKDLLWMHHVGIGGIHLFDAGLNTPQIVPRRIEYMTPEWREHLRYAVQLADSLGMDIVLPSAPGWSNTGGPWVAPDDAMKRIEWRDTVVCGGTDLTLRLPQPYTCSTFYQNYVTGQHGIRQTPYYKDLYVLAVPVANDEHSMAEMVKTMTCTDRHIDCARLYDGQISSSQAIARHTPPGPVWITAELRQPYTIRSMTLADSHVLGTWEKYPDRPTKFLECSDDGIHYRRVCQIPNSATPRLTLSIPPTRARFFRLTYDRNAIPVSIAEFTLSTTNRIAHSEEKAGFGGPIRLIDYPTPTSAQTVEPSQVTDLATLTDSHGTLRWTAPPGRWRIYRFGYSLTGKENHPASPEATGLEVDKLDSAAMRRYMEAYLATYTSALGDSLMQRAVSGLLIDSYEAGYATWTPRMRQEFRNRRGYDLLPWLPTLAGQIVGSADRPDRFLQDWRQTLGELITDNLYGQAHRVAREHGLTTYFEAMENTRPFIADGIAPKSRADIPMAAMWARTQTLQFTQKMFIEMQADLQEAASAAHLYGRRIVAAESFTVYGRSQGDSLVYALTPDMLKRVADLELACGVNRIVIHESTHQPIDSLRPGLSLDIYGMWFNRLNTWAWQARPWTDYIARSCYMMQQGTNVADIAYFYGDEANATALFDAQKPPIPPTLNFDYVNAEALTQLLTTDGTTLSTPGGARYRLLALGGTSDRMALPTLRALHRLAVQGATIVGRRPMKSTGLATDTVEWAQLAHDIWDTQRPNVIATDSIALGCEAIGLQPDFTCSAMDSIRFVHRVTPSADIYWVNNRSLHRVRDTFCFRITGRRPQRWNPVTGQVTDLSYSVGTHTTYVEVDMQPADAFFIVFADKPHTGLRHQVPPTVVASTDTLSTAWTVHFDRQMGTPDNIVMPTLKSYTDPTLTIADSAQARAVKYFSGTTTYRNTFFLTQADSTLHTQIDLGKVCYIAEVWVNGRHCGISWISPHSIDISHAVRPGLNTLEIRVTNPWKNRLIGDRLARPGEPTYTWTSYPWNNKTRNTLMPAGLLGPVTISRICKQYKKHQ